MKRYSLFLISLILLMTLGMQPAQKTVGRIRSSRSGKRPTACLLSTRSGPNILCLPSSGHVDAGGRDRRHHVEQRRADVREHDSRLRQRRADARADRADFRHALFGRPNDQLQAAAGAGDAVAGGAPPTRSAQRNFSNGSKPSTTVAPRWDSTPSRAVCSGRPTAVSCAPERCSTPSGRPG